MCFYQIAFFVIVYTINYGEPLVLPITVLYGAKFTSVAKEICELRTELGVEVRVRLEVRVDSEVRVKGLDKDRSEFGDRSEIRD